MKDKFTYNWNSNLNAWKTAYAHNIVCCVWGGFNGNELSCYIVHIITSQYKNDTAIPVSVWPYDSCWALDLNKHSQTVYITMVTRY